MDEIKPSNQEKRRRRRNSTFICRETGDHAHYPPKRRIRSTRPKQQSSSQILESSLIRVTSYGQCKKNQAAEIGSTAYDGCGEFVSAEEDSLNCAACGCHRNFHEEESPSDTVTENGVSETVLKALKISPDQFRKIFCSPYGGGRKYELKKKESSGGDRIGIDRSGGGVEDEAGRTKRLKTKFTAEQTEKMRDYAEKLRWKVGRERREEVEEFCSGIGVNLKNFRIWMTNHSQDIYN